MTQLLTDVGQMAFESIGFHAALILNRLRNQKQIHGSEEQRREADEREKERVNGELPVRLIDKN
jgi:hypothetical protein